MSASELFKQGALEQAIQAQIQEVKSNPADANKRVFLFELLAFSGDLDRARKQIEAVRYQDMEQQATVDSYCRLLDAEEARRKLMEGGVPPQFLEDIPEHAELRLKAIQALRDGRTDDAVTLLNQAREASPPVTGLLNGKRFDGLQDCDDLFGTVLEVMMFDKYIWIPLEQVTSVAANPPRFPRDYIWLPARMEMAKSGTGIVFLPNLYLNSHREENDQLKLGRLTDFTSSPPIRGRGSRLFLAGEDAVSLLEIRELKIDQPEDAGLEAAPEGE